MKGIKTPEQFIDHMWKSKLFSDAINVKKIQDIAESEGYTFSKSTTPFCLRTLPGIILVWSL